jgi:hypothetical protein
MIKQNNQLQKSTKARISSNPRHPHPEDIDSYHYFYNSTYSDQPKCLQAKGSRTFQEHQPPKKFKIHYKINHISCLSFDTYFTHEKESKQSISLSNAHHLQ